MRVRIALALVVAAVSLAAVASTATGGTQANTLTVWLQVDAQTATWEPITKAANAQFESTHPGWTVDVQYQTWGTHLQKFDATLAGGNAPDVIEMGNTEMTKYMAAGAFQDLGGIAFPNQSTWLEGLALSGRFAGKVYGVPYYAGARVVTYRTDLFKSAGVKVPTSLAAFTLGAKKLAAKNNTKGFSPVYLAGTDWYTAMSFVHDFGWQDRAARQRQVEGDARLTQVGCRSDRVQGVLPRSVEGQQDDGRDPSAAVRRLRAGSGGVDRRAGLVQLLCGRQVQGCDGAVRDAQPHQGMAMPVFLGGSDLAVPVGASKTQAADWIRGLHGQRVDDEAPAGDRQHPQHHEPAGQQRRRAGGRRSWFVPTAKNWVNVENGNVLRTMLAQILTGRLTVKQAATAASENIAFTLNQ